MVSSFSFIIILSKFLANIVVQTCDDATEGLSQQCADPAPDAEASESLHSLRALLQLAIAQIRSDLDYSREFNIQCGHLAYCWLNGRSMNLTLVALVRF